MLHTGWHVVDMDVCTWLQGGRCACVCVGVLCVVRDHPGASMRHHPLRLLQNVHSMVAAAGCFCSSLGGCNLSDRAACAAVLARFCGAVRSCTTPVCILIVFTTHAVWYFNRVIITGPLLDKQGLCVRRRLVCLGVRFGGVYVCCFCVLLVRAAV